MRMPPTVRRVTSRVEFTPDGGSAAIPLPLRRAAILTNPGAFELDPPRGVNFVVRHTPVEARTREREVLATH